jgi:hypothetical protein
MRFASRSTSNDGSRRDALADAGRDINRHPNGILEKDPRGVMLRVMERLNLNVPSEARASLKRLAEAAKLREAEYARELLVRAIEAAEREKFFSELERKMTPAARKRLVAVAGAVEKVRRGSR